MLFMYVVCHGDTGTPEGGKDVLWPLANRCHREIRSMLHNTCATRLIFIMEAQELPKFGRARVKEAEAIGVFTPKPDNVITIYVWNLTVSALFLLFKEVLDHRLLLHPCLLYRLCRRRKPVRVSLV
jgi:hypothetical protein